ncbi:porin family protein [Shewanella psychropiezotolerans]|uniref:Porin family protein n=1 Tax=Shewanella psychropiezotolerans TaxID=2593655 RepID=A0ABX5X755_9GAMM|nr:porin family protein [Shewanella psychropiezotolerans]QDO85738.1 porin family protein [Shewanella psychropiezotolerans]
MKSAILRVNSNYKVARGLAVLSLISTGEKLNSRGFSQRKNTQNKRRKPRVRLPYAWFGILCCLFIVQASAAVESDYPTLGNNFFDAYDYQYMAEPNRSDKTLGKNKESKSRLNLNFNSSENLLVVEYHFSPQWQVSFESLRIGGSMFFADSLYQPTWRYLDSDRYSDPVSSYASSSYSNGLYEGWGASVVRTFKLTGRLSSQIYFGAYHWQEERLNFSGADKDASRGISPYGGGGIKYRLSDEVSIMLDWNHFEIQGENHDQLGLKFQYRF